MAIRRVRIWHTIPQDLVSPIGESYLVLCLLEINRQLGLFEDPVVSAERPGVAVRRCGSEATSELLFGLSSQLKAPQLKATRLPVTIDVGFAGIFLWQK